VTMIELTALHIVLLDLGLEDWIPLPEAVEDALHEGRVGVGDSACVSNALVELLREGLIEVWSGSPSAAEPSPVSPALAEAMLLDLPRYTWRSKADLHERVYYVNVKNFRTHPGPV
jgi:hypothetical protein